MRADETPEAQPVHLQVADLVSKDSIIAIAAEEDASYDYDLLKVTTDGVVVLTKDETDDYGSHFQAGNAVVKGNFYLRLNLIDMTFKLNIKKTALFILVQFVMSAQNLKRTEEDIMRCTRFQWTFMMISLLRCSDVLPQFCELQEKVNTAFAATDCRSLVALMIL